MDTRAHYHRLFAHDAWANQEFVGYLQSLPSPPERAVTLLSHIAAAGLLWLGRLGHTEDSVPVWPTTGLEACAAHCEGVATLWRTFVDGLTDARLDETITYTNSLGEAHTSRVGDVIDHVLQHAAYHRGQIASFLRQADLEPPYTDLIHSTRNALLD